MRRHTPDDRAELVDLVTDDDVELPGAFWHGSRLDRPVDAWLLIPGAGASFYTAIQRPFAPALAALGYAALAISTRGHDEVWRNHDGRLFGLATDIVGEAPHDIRAGIAFLVGRGFRRIGLLGHSLGGIKACYFAATQPTDGLSALVMVSAMRLGRTAWQQSPDADHSAATLAQAEALVNAGLGDVIQLLDRPRGRAYLTPNTLLDRFGSDAYDNAANVAAIRLPLLILRGSEETDLIPDSLMATQLARAIDARPRAAVTIDGADHVYQGRAERAVAAIDAFVQTISVAGDRA